MSTHTLIFIVNRWDNFHYVSKSTDCKLCSYLQYVDTVLITVCFYQVDIAHNTQFIFMSFISTLLVSVYMFSVYIMLPILQYCDMHLMVKQSSVFLYEQTVQKL